MPGDSRPNGSEGSSAEATGRCEADPAAMSSRCHRRVTRRARQTSAGDTTHAHCRVAASSIVKWFDPVVSAVSVKRTEIV